MMNVGISEKAVIGCLIKTNKEREIFATITADDFQSYEIAKLFTALYTAYEKRGSLDEAVSDIVSSDLKELFIECVDFLPSLSWKSHVATVKENTAIAKAMSIASEIALGGDIYTRDELREKAEQMMKACEGEKATDSLTMKQAVINLMSEQYTPVKYIKTGFSRLDKYTFIEKGDYIIVGGRPSAGKTAYTIQLANNMAKKGYKICYFSLETRPDKIKNRFIANFTGIPLTAIKLRNMDDWSLQTLARDGDAMAGLNIDIIGASGKTVSWIRSEAIRRKADIAFIDYIGLIPAQGKSRYEKVTNISMDLHNMAQQTGITIIGLSQLSRSDTQRKPRMEDLRESGQIEQDADLIMLLHKGEEIQDSTFDYSVIIEKNKEGMTGEIDFHFMGKTQRFSEVVNANGQYE